ncbi:MAG: hypothetical protein LAT68_14780 [Cyclobacteriaceae bacterium]|nr:hypothetical protein [Cyclobacteriaceae bacterium]MCH8517585.1 hypothetical protein [Cyclobacteriaceae bacterium]
MKNWIITFALLLGAAFQVQSQDCFQYFPYEEGVSYTLTSFTAKGKKEGENRHKILSNTKSGSRTTVEIEMQMLDKKGKEIASGVYEVYCEDGVMYIDNKMFTQMMNMEGMNMDEGGISMEISGDNISFPSGFKVGQPLEDVQMNIKTFMGSQALATSNITFYDREFTAQERLSTAAGDFNAFLLEEKMEMKLESVMTITREYPVKTWYAEGVGVVRVENYDRRGRLSSYSELTEFKRP